MNAEISRAERFEQVEEERQERSALDSTLGPAAGAPQRRSRRASRSSRSSSRSHSRTQSRPPTELTERPAGHSKKVELSFGCGGLPRLEIGSLMPVFAVLWLWRRKERRWQEHGRTEVVRDPAPNFVRSFYLDYVDHADNFSDEHDQWAKVEIYQRKTHCPHPPGAFKRP